MRWGSLFVLVSFAWLALGCGTDENVILLRLRAQVPVETVDVRVSSIEGIGPTQVLDDERIEDSDDIRIAVRLAGPALVTVHVVGRTAAGATLVATRCYAVEGTIEDEAILAGPIGAFDADGDSFASDASQACLEPDGEDGERPCRDGDLHICDDTRAQDCDDSDGAVFPGAAVICQNGADEDCDGEDEPCADTDGDGSNACPPGRTENCDCDDANPRINPGMDEGAQFCNDGVDQDCDGFDTCCDADGDGTPLCRVCSDAAGVPEDRVDQRCIDDASCSPIDPVTGRADPLIPESCVTDRRASGDCDDSPQTGASVAPGMPEVCADTLDNNCNGLIDELAECRGPDQDADGSPVCGHPDADPAVTCEPPEVDCDPGFSPLNREQCDGFDNDVDGTIDEDCPDGDMDGDGQLPPIDCDDTDPLAYDRDAFPGVTLPDIDRPDDGVPQNCLPGGDRSAAEDIDGDGFVEIVPASCERAPERFPGQTEICNGLDDDCDLVTDEVLAPTGTTGCVTLPDPEQDMGMEGVTVTLPVDFAGTTDPSASRAAQLALFLNCGGCRNACDSAYDDQCLMGRCDCASEDGVGSCFDVLSAELGRPPVDPVCNPACGGCADLDSDPNNCGGCGRRCGDGETCTGGVCVCGATTGPGAGMDAGDPEACQGGASECCAGACRDVTSDEDNCGACGYRCGPNTECNRRVCRCDPATDFADCNGDVADSVGMGGDGCEVNLSAPNQQHCGSCGNDCGVNATCDAGSLSCVCNARQLDCNVGRPWCETGFNTSNCGACGASCGSDESCDSAGRCVCGSTRSSPGGGAACSSGEACCEGDCRDLSTTSNCRRCGNRCGANETCGGSDCLCDGGPRCTGADTCCPGPGGNDCVDTDTSRRHCGGCGNRCSAAMGDCGGGNCRCDGGAACGGGMSDTCCGSDGCRDLTSDRNHCGGCGLMCDAGETCSAGSCRCDGGPACAASDTCCPGSGCVDTDDDPMNCGGCGIACGANETCNGGVCECMGGGTNAGGPVCTSGDTCCPGSGCVDTDSDASHCGGCGTVCDAAEGTCQSGSCECGSTGTACAGDASDTCCAGGCVDTTDSTAHCGGCGMACTAEQGTCNAGSCECGGATACAGTASDTCCGGGCVDTTSSDTHCGACDAACASGASCVSSSCLCNGTGDVCFDGVEGDACTGANCRCGGMAACMSPDACSSGMCQ